jgi:glucokinase
MPLLAIDFGGTRTRAGWYSDDMTLIARAEARSQVEQPVEQVLARIAATARQVVPAGAVPAAIGICAPGPLDALAGVIHHAATLPGWQEVPLASLISQALGGAPAYMQNDGNLAAVAEHRLGALRGADPALYLTISTGIGGGAIIDGKLFTGFNGLAIEPGHICIPHPDGNVYRLEQLASGTALGEWGRRALASSDEPSLLRELAHVDGQAVGTAALQGDALAGRVVAQAGHWLGVGLVNLLHLFNPQAVALGGSVAQLGEALLAPARAAIARYLLDASFAHEGLLRPAALGEDVCLAGAALYAQACLGPAA